jgi:hypothetical protein
MKCMHCGWSNLSTSRSCLACGRRFVVAPVYFYVPTTQKLKGLKALQELSYAIHDSPWEHACWVKPLRIKAAFRVDQGYASEVLSQLPAFCRPCPPNPEHGFVESRVINTEDELKALQAETLAVCPEAEIMLTPVFKQVKSNSIWTPTMLSIGPGHDGATAGKGSVSFPLTGASLFSKALLQKAGVDPDKDPYVEAIHAGDDGNIYVTQLRSGPKLQVGASIDFIPAEVVVDEIIQTSGEDLLEWAKVIRGLKDKPGTVVYHPSGSMTDHYSVHCRENGVPILISHKPAIGEVLEPLPMPPLDPQELIRGLAVGDAINTAPLAGGFVCLSLMALHNSAVLRGPYSFWLGVGVAATIKLGSAAMSGEARHAHQAWHGFSSKPDIYGHYGAKSLSFHRARLSRLTQLLHYGFGEKGELAGTDGSTTGCGMGGRKWALCGASLAPLFTSIKKLVDSPTSEAASQLVLDLNVAINQAHNGGWWLNKFITVEAYDEIPKGNIGFILMASEAIRQTGAERHKVDIDRFIRAVSKWPAETTIAPLKWRKADLAIGPGSLVLRLKASTVPKPKEIIIPATHGLMKSLITAVGEIKLRPGEVAIKLNDSNREISLWRENPLTVAPRNPHDRTQ